MPGILDLMGYINQQGEQGRQRGLASLVGKAYSAPQDQRQGILNTVAQRGGTDLAMKAQEGFKQQDDDALDRFSKLSAAYASTRDPTVASQWAQAGVAAGMLPPEAAQRDFNNPADIEGSAKAAQAFAQAFVQHGAGAEVQAFNSLTSGLSPEDQMKARRVKLGLDPRAGLPSVFDANGNGVFLIDRAGRQADPVSLGGQPQGQQPQPPTGDPQQIQGQFASLAGGFPGTQISSGQRTPEHNREVGGVPNSQHIPGTASDFVVPPQEKAAFIARAQSQGFEAIDEGDHVHLELPPPGGQQGGGQLRSAPKPQAPSDMERRLALAQQMGATPDQMQSMVLGSAAPKQSTPAQQAKMQLTARKERMMLSANDAQVDQTVKLIDSIIARKGDLGGVTGIGRVGAKIPGTDWADVAAKLDTLKGRSAFGALQQMRANSPTGGALGQVSERELYLLQNAETQLQDSQSPESLVKALQDYKTALLESKRRMRDGMSEFYTEQGVGQQPASHGGGVDDLLSKYGIK